MAILVRLAQAYKVVIRRENRIYNIIVVISGFVLSLGIFLILTKYFRFEYQGYRGIIGWLSEHQYPKQQELFFYLLALVIVPGITLGSWASWWIYSTLISFLRGVPVEKALRWDSFTYLPWLLVFSNVDVVHPSFKSLFLIPLLLIMFLKLFGLFPAYFVKLKTLVLNKTLSVYHGGVISSGFCVGVFFLIIGKSYFVSTWQQVTFLLALPLSVWVFWLAFSYLWSVNKKLSFQDALRLDAFTYFPAAILLLGTVLFPLPKTRGFLLGISIVLVVSLKLFNLLGPKKNIDKVFSEDVYRILLSCLVVPLLIYGLFYSSNIHGQIDFFHEGEILGPAGGILRGKILYLDIWIHHGLFEDAYKALLSFKLFGESLASTRLLINILGPLGLIGLYFLALKISRSIALSFLVVFLMSVVGIFWNNWMGRYLFGFFALAFAAGYVDSKKLHHLIIAGICTSLAIFYSLDVGVYVFSACLLFLLIMGVVSTKSPIRRRFSPLWGYLGGVALGALPFTVFLLSKGALTDYIDISFVKTPFFLNHIFGTSFPSLAAELKDISSLLKLRGFLLSKTFKYYFPLLVYLLTLVYLLLRAVLRTFRKEEWKLLLVLLAGIAFFRTALGRSDFSHLKFATPFTWLICALFLREFVVRFKSACSQRMNSPRANFIFLFRGVLMLFSLLVFLWYLFSAYNPLVSLKGILERLTTYGEGRAGYVYSSLPRVGPIQIPPNQAQSIEKVASYIHSHTLSDEPIFCFSNSGLYYFLLDRPNPTRFYQIIFAATPSLQKEVIQNLEKSKPQYVIFEPGGADGIINARRLPLIFTYLSWNYYPEATVGGTPILKRRSAVLWTKKVPLVVEWKFDSTTLGWQAWHDIDLFRVENGVLRIKSTGKDPYLVSPQIEIIPSMVSSLEIRMSVTAGSSGRIFWATLESPVFDQKRSQSFALKADGNFHTYVLELSELLSWRWTRNITELRLDPTNEPAEIKLDYIRLKPLRQMPKYSSD